MRSPRIRNLEDVRPGPEREPVSVGSPIKAHLLDGKTVLFEFGALVGRDTIWGRGRTFDLGLRPLGGVQAIPMDSVAALEAFGESSNVAASAGLTMLGTAAVLVGSAALAVAIFGSCPTVYAGPSGHQILQAETFSYSIAPVFEMRDVDRLTAQPDASGRLVLEVRDEALETHYINHLELLKAVARRGETVVPDRSGRVLALGPASAPVSARDRAGRHVETSLAARDGSVYATDAGVLSRADETDPDDTIELAFALEGPADSAAVHFRMRNSLLLTVLFYDVMLADPGARALDWMHEDLDRIGPAVQLGQWVANHLGMRIEVWDGTSWRPAGRIPDTGPIAWKDVGVVVPVPPAGRDSLRLRLTFPADSWRIDLVEASAHWRRLESRRVPLRAVVEADGRVNPDARASLAAPDTSYLVLAPGQRFEAVFEPGPPPPGGSEATYFLGSQGYYTEWMRRAWLTGRGDQRPFRPGPAALAEAQRLWRAGRDTLEARFYSTRLVVR